MAFAPEPSTRFGAKSAMNTEAFPFEFLQKYFPKLARVEPTFVGSTAAEDDRSTLTLPFCRRRQDSLTSPESSRSSCALKWTALVLASWTRTIAISNSLRRRAPRAPYGRRYESCLERVPSVGRLSDAARGCN